MPGELCESADEPGRAEVHNYRMGSPSSGLRLQEIPSLPTQIPDRLPHGP